MVAEDRSLTKEEVREVVLEVLAETSGEAGKTASQLLAEVEGRTEKALGELDQLLAQIHESEEESKAETAETPMSTIRPKPGSRPVGSDRMPTHTHRWHRDLSRGPRSPWRTRQRSVRTRALTR